MRLGNLVLLTKFCSAQCKHCRFSYGNRTDYLSIKKIHSEINKKEEPVIILSGGEPLEHPDISLILENINFIDDKIFRIATGGHIDLSKYIFKMEKIENLTGISLGTDILIKSRRGNHLENLFWKNISILNDSSLFYSLTFTLGNDISIREIETILRNKNLNPSFFLLQYRDDQDTDQNLLHIIKEKINILFPGKIIYYGYIN